MKQKREIVYVAVMRDQYSLPLHVTESAPEMARWSGVRTANVREEGERNAELEAAGLPLMGSRRRRYCILRVMLEDETRA